MHFRTLGPRCSALDPAAFRALLFELKILAPPLEFKSNSEASLPCYRKKYSTVIDGKESTCSAGDLGSTPGSGISPGGGNGSPLQYSCLGKSHGQRSLAGYSPWGGKESDTSDSTHDCYTKTRMKFLASPTLLDFCLLSFPRIRGDGSHVTLQRFSSKGQSSCMTGKGDFHLTTCIFCFFSGSPYYDNVRPLSYPDSDAVLICFDISRPETLDSVLKKVSSRE